MADDNLTRFLVELCVNDDLLEEYPGKKADVLAAFGVDQTVIDMVLHDPPDRLGLHELVGIQQAGFQRAQEANRLAAKAKKLVSTTVDLATTAAALAQAVHVEPPPNSGSVSKRRPSPAKKRKPRA